MPPLDISDFPAGIDYTKTFLTYCTFLGDVDKTSIATGIGADFLRHISERDRWSQKVRQLAQIRKDQGIEAFTRELNRTSNYVQAIQLRTLLDRVIQNLTDNKQSLEDFVTVATRQKGGGEVKNKTGRNFADLTRAVEAVQRMTYVALGDGQVDRLKVGSDSGDEGDEKTKAKLPPSMAVFRGLAALATSPQLPRKPTVPPEDDE